MSNSATWRLFVMSDEIVLDQVVVPTLVGRVFYDNNLVSALKAVQDYVGSQGHIASLPELFHARVISPADSFVWNNWFCSISEEDFGTTKQGNSVVAVVHGGGIFSTPERIERAFKEGLVNGAGKISQEEFNNLLEGKLPDKTEIPVYSYEDFLRQKDLPRQYGIILDFNTVKNLPSGVQNISFLYENPLMIARSGGQEQAKQYLDKAKKVYKKDDLGFWHPFKDIDTSQPAGRLLFVGGYYDYFDGSDYLDGDARLVGVSSSTEGAQKISAPTLEQVLAVTNKFTAEPDKEQLRSALSQLYHK